MNPPLDSSTGAAAFAGGPVLGVVQSESRAAGPVPSGCPSSADLAATLAAIECSAGAATVVGYGRMGQEYVKALRALGVRRIRVCSRSSGSWGALQHAAGVEAVAGGVEHFDARPEAAELGIIAIPTALLSTAAERLARLGFRRLLVEKPIALWSKDIDRLADTLERQGVEAYCAYNRVAYPSFHEVRMRTFQDGGVTSCTYTFTEMIKPEWVQRFPPEELARWGIANSLHVMSMAHRLIGWPTTWSGHRAGALPWHRSGAVFVGSGISERGIPFTYHADWGSTGRWSVEAHSPVSSYRLCPLEHVFRRPTATSPWEELPVTVFAPDVKAGILEQVAAMLNTELRAWIPLVSLREAARLTRYAEELFGYPQQK